MNEIRGVKNREDREQTSVGELREFRVFPHSFCGVYPSASVFFSGEFQFGIRNGVQIAENSASILEQLLARQNSYKLSGDPTADPETATDPSKDLKNASEFEFSSAKTIASLRNLGR